MILRPHSKWEGVRGSSSPTSGNTYVGGGGGGRSLMIRIASVSTMTVIKSMNDRPKTFLIAVLVKPMVESSCGSSCAFLTDS